MIIWEGFVAWIGYENRPRFVNLKHDMTNKQFLTYGKNSNKKR